MTTSPPLFYSEKPVLAATPWPRNADLVVDVHRLGYLLDEDHVLDPTYGRGVWWQKWRPLRLTTHDIMLDGVDFRDLPYDDNTFDAIAYDPPYVCVGGRNTTTMADFQNRYGIDVAPKTPSLLQALINDGLTEMHRVVKPRKTYRRGGVVLVKCQDYVANGKVWHGTYHTMTHALSLGFTVIDRLERIQHNPRPQPMSNRTQQHARRNLSTLFVLRKAK